MWPLFVIANHIFIIAREMAKELMAAHAMGADGGAAESDQQQQRQDQKQHGETRKAAVGSPPSLEAHGIDRMTGFLRSHPPPLRRLPHAAFDPWEDVLADLNQLLVAGALRSRVRKLPEFETNLVQTELQLQRAYLLLSFVAQAYVVGIPKADPIESVLPAVVAVPWVAIARRLGVKPVISYAVIGLYNWFPLDTSELLHLGNLGLRHTFSGVFDEAWFYLIPLAIEIHGGPILSAFVNAQHAILANDEASVAAALTVVANNIDAMIRILKRMYEKNDPHIFWNRVRPFAGGSKNSPALPNGLFYEGVAEIDEFVNPNSPPPPDGLVGTWRQYAGASAGQSPLIHAIDVAMSIHHASMPASGSNTSNASGQSSVNPMLEMRSYLSAADRGFIEALSRGPSIRGYIATLPATSLATAEFNRAIEALRIFRDTHIQMTTVYIILQQKKDTSRSGGSAMTVEGAVGTGGTDLIPFLKQTRQETANAAVQSSR